jgi:hypothetical protein
MTLRKVMPGVLLLGTAALAFARADSGPGIAPARPSRAAAA